VRRLPTDDMSSVDKGRSKRREGIAICYVTLYFCIYICSVDVWGCTLAPAYAGVVDGWILVIRSVFFCGTGIPLVFVGKSKQVCCHALPVLFVRVLESLPDHTMRTSLAPIRSSEELEMNEEIRVVSRGPHGTRRLATQMSSVWPSRDQQWNR
jgi:hypothetical protein